MTKPKPLDLEEWRKKWLELWKEQNKLFAKKYGSVYGFNFDLMLGELKQRIKSAAQGLIQDVEKMENYVTKIQKEDLTEFMKGYWKGQQNLINELKRQIKKWFPDACKSGERK